MRFATLLCALGLVCGSAAAGVVVLKNGRAVAGLSDFELLPAQLRALTEDGVVIYFDLDQIDREATVRLNPKPSPVPPPAAPDPESTQETRPSRPGGGAFSAGVSKVVAESPGWTDGAAGQDPVPDSDPAQPWRRRAAELNRSIDHRERQLRREQLQLGGVLVAESVGAYTVEGALARQRIERSLAHLQELHQQRRELEDQARRAGVPPGWLREE